MGSTERSFGRVDDEKPIHQVTITKPIAVGKFEVSFAEWEACVSDGGCDRYSPSDAGWGRGKRPAINVSWTDAKNYVQWLSEKTGKTYRLLTESEWEYAARAGTTGRFSFDGTDKKLCSYANHADKSSGYRWKKVGSQLKNDPGSPPWLSTPR